MCTTFCRNTLKNCHAHTDQSIFQFKHQFEFCASVLEAFYLQLLCVRKCMDTSVYKTLRVLRPNLAFFLQITFICSIPGPKWCFCECSILRHSSTHALRAQVEYLVSVRVSVSYPLGWRGGSRGLTAAWRNCFSCRWMKDCGFVATAAASGKRNRMLPSWTWAPTWTHGLNLSPHCHCQQEPPTQKQTPWPFHVG